MNVSFIHLNGAETFSSPTFMEHQILLPCSKGTDIGLCPEPDES
jgi:hypothetical protein